MTLRAPRWRRDGRPAQEAVRTALARVLALADIDAAIAELATDKLVAPAAAPTPAPPATGPFTTMLIGSSTPLGWATTGAGPSNSQVTYSADGTSFGTMTTGMAGMTYGDALQRATGRAQRIIGRGQGGTRLRQWEADESGILTNAIAAGQAAGGVDAVVLIVGFNDAYGGSLVSAAEHATLSRSLCAKIRAGFGNPNLRIYLGFSQKTGGTVAIDMHQRFDALTAAEQAVVDDGTVRFGAHSYDIPQSDNIHQTTVGYGIHGNRMAGSVIADLLGNTIARGASVASISAPNETETIVKLAHSTGSDFTPASGITGFTLSGSSTIAIASATRLSADEVRLTHANLTGTRSLSLLAGATPDRTAVVKDNSALGLPINPTTTILTADYEPATTPTPIAARTAMIDFATTSGSTPAGFNRFSVQTGAAGGTLGTIADTDGATTGWSMQNTGAFTTFAANGAQSATDSGAYPNAVLASYWFNGDPISGGSRIPSTPFRIAGLDPAKTYTLRWLGSRKDAVWTTTYSAGGEVRDLPTDNNVSATREINGLVPDASGNLDWSFGPKDAAIKYGYVNVMEIIEEAAA